jgi:hypothetical protein
MDSAAKAVRNLGKEGDKTSGELEALDLIEDHLATQTEQLSAVLEVLQRQLDETGDEALQAALKLAAMNQAMKKPGSNAIFLGKSFAFWKDRLSITRSEILGTAYTISAYLSPALLALGSSFTMALLGGATVGVAGLSGFIFGLVTLGLITGKAVDNIDKIRKAQEQYNVTVDQYGAASKQASRASARLGAIIKNNGGMQAAMALAAQDRLSRQWDKGTAPARGDIFGSMQAGIGSLQNILPVVMQEVNRMADSTRIALTGAFQSLTGPDTIAAVKALGGLFTEAIGPGTRGAVSVIKTFFRIVTAGAPWAMKWARAWERWALSMEKGTRDRTKVQKFVDNAVDQFKTWWTLAKSLGTTMKIIFSNFGEEGKSLVKDITSVVDKFNEWLKAAKDSGAIDRAFQRYLDSLKQVVWAIQNPLDAIEKYVPKAMDAIVVALVTHAPKAAELFLTTFFNAGIWTQLITAAFLAKKFGLLGKVWENTAGLAVDAFAAGFATKMGDPKKMEKFSTAGNKAGKAFGAGFVIGAAIGLGLIVDTIIGEVLKKLGVDTLPGQKTHNPIQGTLGYLKDQVEKLNNPRALFPRIGGATGGLIPQGGAAWVGESGPEIATANPWGTQITPLSRNGLESLRPAELPNMSGALNIYLTTSVQVNRREIARAYSEETSYITARRGGTAPSG